MISDYEGPSYYDYWREQTHKAWAEIRGLRKDAERYRWLKRNGQSDTDILWDYQGDELDRVIDSEIAREGANSVLSRAAGNPDLPTP